MKNFTIQFGEKIIFVTNLPTDSGNDEINSAIDKFKVLILNPHSICLEDYKIFNDVDWLGDDDGDIETIWGMVCDYICSILGVKEYQYEGDNFPTSANPISEVEINAIKEF